MRLGKAAPLGGGALLVILLIAFLTGEDPTQLLDAVNPPQVSVDGGGAYPSGGGDRPTDEGADFVSVVLADTEDTWNALFAQRGERYREPNLVLFSDAVSSACGFNSAAVGPFYCPADDKVYLDLSFFADLHRRFGAPGDFAQAYVIAHEVGHHVQNLLGISDQVHRLRSRAGRAEANALSVRMELQADCLAGVWGYHANRQRRMLEPGDVEEGLRAAAAIGDDRLQRQAGGYVHPESWTHGSSEQRVRWLRRGLESGRMEVCDTFEADRL
jgi:hypothetical protein